MRYRLALWVIRQVVRRIDPEFYGELMGSTNNLRNEAYNLDNQPSISGVEAYRLAFRAEVHARNLANILNYHKR